MEGGGAPLAAHMSEKGSPGFTTRSLKEDTIRGVPSKGQRSVERKGSVLVYSVVSQVFISR